MEESDVFKMVDDGDDDDYDDLIQIKFEYKYKTL